MTRIITSPLYYVNDSPHLGSTYTTLACDSYARYARINGEEVEFITGVDEHGLKIQRTADKQGVSPQKHCDTISQNYVELWNKFHITNTSFIRTTSTYHKKVVEEFFNRVNENGDIEIGRQQGWYCVGCEEFKDDNSLNDDKVCEIHKRKLEWRDEENLFFKLSNYQDEIQSLINKENFIYPLSRKNEIQSFVSSGLKDFSISRVNVPWGIPVPGYNGHTFYVWFDALLGYLSAIIGHKQNCSLDNIEEFGWPNVTHIIGKDILRFHAVYWPAMLISAGIKVPKKIVAHGFLTREGKKMGKSIGNVLDPNHLIKVLNRDSIRWYLLKDFKFGNDGDIQKQRLKEIINNDLCNTIGNLLNRTTSMSRKWYQNSVPSITKEEQPNKIQTETMQTIENYKKSIENLEFHNAAESILNLAVSLNVYINESQPWKLIKDSNNKDKVSNIIYNILESSRIIGLLLYPITPDLSNRILQQLSYELPTNDWEKDLVWGQLKNNQLLPEPIPVMTRLEDDIDI